MADMIQEFCDSRGVKLSVNREAGIIEGVKVLGLESKNGRSYPKETVARAVGLYEGSKVNIDHTESPGGPRGYRDRLGQLRNVRVEQGTGGLRADFHFNPKHALAEQLIWDAEHAPENVGFSHNVEAKVTRKDGKTVVEEIIRVQSVDLVADPATTRGLFEQVTPTGKGNTLEWNDITEAALREHKPDVAKAIADKALAEHANSQEQKAAADRLKALTEEVDAYKAREVIAAKASTVAAELAEAKLPAELVSDVFKATLMEAKDKAARAALIEDRRGLAAGVKPQSKEQQVTEGAAAGSIPSDAKSFAAAITE